MPKLTKIFHRLDEPLFFQRTLAALVLLLLAWCTFTTQLLHQSPEALVSSGRLVVETSLVLLVLYFSRLKIPDLLMSAVIAISVLNSIVVILQLLEGTGCISTSFNRLITDFWVLGVNEYTRKPGFFNGVQTSSFCSFFALVLLARRKDPLAILFMVLSLFPIFFGSRTFLIFVPVLLLINLRLLAGGVAALGLFVLVGYSCGTFALVQNHFEERLIPTAKVVMSADPQQDYSSKDLITHYKEPGKLTEWLIGNGQPRYSDQGGKDPAISRWLLQTGAPGAALVFMISSFICFRILMKRTVPDVLFAMSLALSTFKGELVTATLIFLLLAVYALCGVSFSPKNKIAVSENRA